MFDYVLHVVGAVVFIGGGVFFALFVIFVIGEKDYKEPQKRRQSIILMIIGLLPICLAFYAGVFLYGEGARNRRTSLAWERLMQSSELDTFRAIEPIERQRSQPCPVFGPAVVVTKGTDEVDAHRSDEWNNFIFGCLPQHLQAQSADEVQTVILANWQAFKEGRYSGGMHGYAYSTQCKAIVVDRKTRLILDTTTFHSYKPRGSSPHGGTEYGYPRKDQIDKFFARLADRCTDGE